MRHARSTRVSPFKALVPLLATCLLGAGHAQTKWVASWATAPEPLVSSQSTFNPPAPGLANNSARQVLRVSIGGDTLRMRFTNEYTPSAVKILGATLAVSTGAGAIDTTTLRQFKFSGNDSVTMGANASVWSDPLAFSLAPGAKVEVTIHFGAAPASGTYPGITVHRGSRTTPRVLAGNQLRAPNFAGAGTIAQGSWVISSLEVRAPQSAGAVAILGNSITDGFGILADSFTRWTDALTTNLLAHARTRNVGVLNGGIGAGNMLTGGVSTPGLQRYKRDLFDHASVKWIIILLGVNDIGNTGCSVTTSDAMIAAYAQIADSARARGIKVYGATLTPFNGNGYYSTNSEACRQRINTWVRSTPKYDAVIDFDKIVRNPADTSRILATYNNDGLHPNAAGYALMGNSIDTNLFIATASALAPRAGEAAGYALGGISAGHQAGLRVAFRLPREERVRVTVFDSKGVAVSRSAVSRFGAGEHAVTLRAPKAGVYLVKLQAGETSLARKVVVPGG
jgi:lysophospholipase L1-like esterase